jgi:MFS family permease
MFLTRNFVALARLRRAVRQFTWGGLWAISLPVSTKRNLSWFFFDGLFASASDNIYLTYLTLFLLSLGASKAQIGLMSSLSSFSAALLLLPGALLVERLGRRKEVTVLFGGVLARVMILGLALLPLLTLGPSGLVWAAVCLSVLRDAFGNFAFPAWMSVTGDIVPIEGRGRYFGTRNFVMGIAGMLVIFLFGEAITRIAAPLGFQIALGAAFGFGILSTFAFARLRDPRAVPDKGAVGQFSFGAALRDLKCHPSFVTLGFVMALWNFSLNISGPFFSVFMVDELKFTASMVGIATITTTISSLVFQRRIGRLSDRLGPRRLQLICMLLIPILPFSWVFVDRLWQVIPLNAFGGIIWGAFNLVSFNFLLSMMPDALRARYSAIYQILITLALAAGAAFGSWIVTEWSYRAVFLGSGIGRVVAALLFAWLVVSREKGQDATDAVRLRSGS